MSSHFQIIKAICRRSNSWGALNRYALAAMAISQLPPEEISRRIKAARDMRAVSQTELAQLLAEDGINISDLGRIERCDPKVPLRLIHQDAIIRHLRIPERWLTEPDLDVVLGLGTSESSSETETLSQLARDVAGLVESRRATMDQLGPLLNDPEAARDVLNWAAQALAARRIGKRELQSRAAADRLAGPG